MIREPRPHQLEAMQKLRQSLSLGKKKPLLQAPTGAGKSLIAAMIVEGALKKGNSVIFVVPYLSLIDQTIDAFETEGITQIGVMQGQHERTDFTQPVQIASIQTLKNRSLPPAQVIICDEAHLVYRFMADWMQHPDWQKTVFIGLSATPWTKGLGKLYDDLIVVETTQGLIDKGFLSPFEVYACDHPDLTGIKTVGGDYHEGQLSERMGSKKLVAGIVATWLEKGEDRPTLCFAVDRAHAKKIQQEFEQAGVSCGYVDAFTTREERLEMKKRFHDGEIKVVASIGTLIAGVDWDVRCIIMARPTKSKMLLVQSLGRGLRTAQGKDLCKILDFSDNSLRLGLVTDINQSRLCTGKKNDAISTEQPKKEKLPSECSACSFLKPAGVYECPKCGFKPTKQPKIEMVEGELKLFKGKQKQFSLVDKQAWYSGLIYIGQEKGYKETWPAAIFMKKFKEWPNGLKKIPVYPTMEVSNYVRSRQIAYAKGRAKNAG